jgi:hypothetical protein
MQLSLFPPEIKPTEDFVDSIRRFSEFGQKTREADGAGVPFLFNEFWTSRQRQAHRIHEVSYRACFKPQLPEFFIGRLTRPGESVYDPFMGRGTTPIQAALMGRKAIGVDVNPLSRHLTFPRLNPPALSAVARRLEEIPWGEQPEQMDEDLLVFFHPQTLREICRLREWLLAREKSPAWDVVDAWIRMVALNRLTGHSAGFFSVYTLPPNQAVSLAAQKKINLDRQQRPPQRKVKEIILKKSRLLLGDEHTANKLVHQLHTAAAENTPFIRDGTVDLVVTSPPFLDVVDYTADNWLRCWFAGIDAQSVPVSIHRKPADWMAFMRKVFVELARVVRPGGHVAFEVGEVRGGSIELEKLVLEAIEALPFTPRCVLINTQKFTKTANCWGVDNNRKGTNSNRIVVLQRNSF